jgi:hypothetical protein
MAEVVVAAEAGEALPRIVDEVERRAPDVVD